MHSIANHLVDVGVDTFLEEWIAPAVVRCATPTPPPTLPSDERTLRTGLASSLRLAGTGALVSVGNRLPELAMPVLVMAGERDTKFTAIGRQLAGSAQRGTFESIAGADHAAHLQRPDAVVALLRRWMRATA